MAASQADGSVRWRAFAPRLRWLFVATLAGCGTPPALSTTVLRASVAPGSPHLVLGEPKDADPSDDVFVDHHVFALSYNPRRRVPNWVAWALVAEDLGRAPRSEAFHEDEQLPAGMPAPHPHDYRRSGFDRGHMCPSGDRTSTTAANEETFVMTNVQPQRRALNVGPWEGLERFERSLASAGKQVFIVAGGLFDVEPETLETGIAVPRANFKIMVVVDRGQSAADVTPATTTYAVIMPNTVDVSGTVWSRYLVSIDDIERQSGYDFLSQVPTDTQALLEARPAPPPAGNP